VPELCCNILLCGRLAIAGTDKNTFAASSNIDLNTDVKGAENRGCCG